MLLFFYYNVFSLLRLCDFQPLNKFYSAKKETFSNWKWNDRQIGSLWRNKHFSGRSFFEFLCLLYSPSVGDEDNWVPNCCYFPAAAFNSSCHLLCFSSAWSVTMVTGICRTFVKIPFSFLSVLHVTSITTQCQGASLFHSAFRNAFRFAQEFLLDEGRDSFSCLPCVLKVD